MIRSSELKRQHNGEKKMEKRHTMIYKTLLRNKNKKIPEICSSIAVNVPNRRIEYVSQNLLHL